MKLTELLLDFIVDRFDPSSLPNPVYNCLQTGSVSSRTFLRCEINFRYGKCRVVNKQKLLSNLFPRTINI